MAGNEAWQGIWLKIERAREHVRDLETRMIAFLRQKPYKAVLSQETATGQHVISARVEEQPPIWWGAIAGDAVRNLRSALDLLVYQLVLTNGAFPTTETGFPIATSAADYLALSEQSLAGVAGPVRAQIDGLHPYRGGNAALWRLEQLAGVDRRSGLVPASAARKAMLDVVSGLDFPNTPITISPGYPNKVVFPIENGTELARVSRAHGTAQLAVYDQGAFYVSFGELDAVGGAPLLPTLNTLVNATDATVQPFIRLLVASE
jgi:hypothetical protein